MTMKKKKKKKKKKREREGEREKSRKKSPNLKELLVDDGEDDDGERKSTSFTFHEFMAQQQGLIFANTDRKRQGTTKLFYMFVNLRRCPSVFDIPQCCPSLYQLYYFRCTIGEEQRVEVLSKPLQ